MSYLDKTAQVWQAEYPSENVESHVFRAYGRVLKKELAMLCDKQPKVLDYGCGEGAALAFFQRQGLDVYGVDVSRAAIQSCQKKMPDMEDHFRVISPKPTVKDDFFGVKFDFIQSMQVLYYMDDIDLSIRLESLYEQLNPGGLIYISMVSEQCYWFENSEPAANGARLVKFDNGRYKMTEHHMAFTRDEAHLLEKFNKFEKLHIGYYDAKYLESEGSELHYTFIGRKPI